MNKIYYLFLLCIFLVACNSQSAKKKNSNNTEKENFDFISRNIDTCKIENEILSHGIINSDYWFENGLPEQFPYALLLGNKYDIADAKASIYGQIYSGYNYPSVYEQIVDDSISKLISDISFDTIKCPRGKNRFDCCMNIEMELLTNLSLSGYFKGKQYYIPDSISFNLALNSLKESAVKRVDIYYIINMYYIYFAGYGVKPDIKNAQYWFKNYITALSKRNTLSDIKRRKVETAAMDNQLIVHGSKAGKISGVKMENIESMFPKNIIREIKLGNIEIYNKLKKITSKSNSSFEILLFSVIMADKYQYKPAFYDVYIYLWKTFNYKKTKELWDLSGFDSQTRSFALYHLKKSASFGDEHAKEILAKIENKL